MASNPKLKEQSGEKEIPQPTEMPASPIMQDEEPIPLPGPQPQTDISRKRPERDSVVDKDNNILRDPFWE